jgi:hypothetical protein
MVKDAQKDAELTHKVTVLREVLRPNEIAIVQYIVEHKESSFIAKSEISLHLMDDHGRPDETDIAYYLSRLEKIKVVQSISKETDDKVVVLYGLHPEIEGFVVDFLEILFPGKGIVARE